MTLLYLTPEDRRWAIRRLKTTARLGLIFAVLGLAMRLSAGTPVTPDYSAGGGFEVSGIPEADVWTESGLLASADDRDAGNPPPFSDSHSSEIRDQHPGTPTSTVPTAIRSVPPAGWRKTSRGWENTSNWPGLGPTINDLIATQKSSEPRWVRTSLAQVKSVPPITIACIQLMAIAMIAGIARLHRNLRQT